MSDKALIDRLGHVVFRPSHDEYMKYCRANAIDSATLAVLKNNTKFTAIPKNDLSFEIKPSRRAIFNVMSVIGKKDKAWVRNHASHIIECYLGEEFRDEWLSAYVKNDDEIDIETLKSISKNKKFILDRITKTIDGLSTCAVDVVEKLTNNIKIYIDDRGELLNCDDLSWIIDFYSLSVIPEEFATSVFIKNDFIHLLIVKDIKSNKMLNDFISKRKIIPELTKSW
jgi:hypothetical protein